MIKRLCITFLLLITTIIATVLLIYQRYAREIRSNIEYQAGLTAQNVALKSEDILETYKLSSLSFYNNPEIIRAISFNNSEDHKALKEHSEEYIQNTEKIQKALFNIYEQHDNLINCNLVTATSSYRMENAYGYAKGGQIRDPQALLGSQIYKQTIIAGGYPIWITSDSQKDYFYWRDYNKYGITEAITLGVSVLSDYKTLGVLFVNIELKSLEAAASAIAEAQDGNIYIVDGNNSIVFLSPSIDKPPLEMNDTLYQEMELEGSGLKRFSGATGNVILSFHNISDSGLFAVYAVNEEVAMDRFVKSRNLVILIMFIALVITILILLWAGISIMKPINHLTAILNRFGHGDFSARYTSDRKDEISRIGDYFNEMADNINNLINEAYIQKINQQELVISQQNTKLYALQTQINPHFLYNTLDIIRWEVMYPSEDKGNAADMIDSFAKLCRMNAELPMSTIPIKKEIEYIRQYITVMNYRQGHKISFEYNPTVREEEYYIPPFILQPIFENAILHGFKNITSSCIINLRFIYNIEEAERELVLPEQKKISITPGCIIIVLKDNGGGMSLLELTSLRRSISSEKGATDSIGLPNISKRLHLLYQDKCDFVIDSEDGKGTTVTLMIPGKTEAEKLY